MLTPRKIRATTVNVSRIGSLATVEAIVAIQPITVVKIEPTLARKPERAPSAMTRLLSYLNIMSGIPVGMDEHHEHTEHDDSKEKTEQIEHRACSHPCGHSLEELNEEREHVICHR